MSGPSRTRRLLTPLAPVYRLAIALRELRLWARLERVRRLHWPVVSVGSLSAGGAGKTPMASALARLLHHNGFAVDVLSRGYGRRSVEPLRVQPQGNADEFGDEPLLIARATGLPVYVAKQRYEAGLLAESDKHDYGRNELARNESAHDDPLHSRPHVHLLDDGFQHRQLARDIDILMLSRADWHDRLLPAGNLRETRRAANRAHAIAIPADEPEFADELKRWGWRGPVWRLRRKMEIPAAAGAVAAFCGIARPEQFFSGLESAGVRVAVRTAFADHHRYTGRDLARVLAAARAAGAAALVTTEKDTTRLGALGAAIAQSLPLITAELRIEIEDEDAALTWLRERLHSTAN